MSVVLGSPAALWLLALLPLVWLAGRVGMTGRTVQRPIHAVARSLVLTCLIAALAQPVVSLPASRVALIYLVDASHSVSARALETAAATIDTMTAGLSPDQSRILVFGGRVAPVADTAALRRLATAAADEVERLVAPDATNLERGLAAARAEIPASTNGRIVLFTDGRDTQGDSQRIVEQLAAERIPVFTTAMPVRDLGDTWIEDVRLSGPAVAHAIAKIELVIGSQMAREVEVALREGTRVVARRRITAAVGTVIVAMDVAFETPGAHLLEATVTAERDALADNNTMQREVVVSPRTRVLYVHADADDAGRAQVALAESGVQVTTALPQQLPTVPGPLAAWDVVVLSDVARTQLSSAAMTALGSWVEEHAGGLLFIGGHSVIGEDAALPDVGYRHTEIERLLPVRFDRDDEPEVALVIVLDRSWSMNGPAMELSKSAAEAAALTLSPAQMLGVLTFNNDSNWDVPLARVRDSQATLHESIAKISASGPTAIYPALDYAYAALSGVRARAKHVILLSDGQTAPDDYQGLIKKMSAAHITVSSVALGPEADVTLLRNLATWGGGRSYIVQDAQQIPEIFVKEAKTAGTPGSEEGPVVQPQLRQSAFFTSSVASLPALRGRNAVTRKPQGIDILTTPRGEPLLTAWPVGLGRTAMFTADVDGRWTRDWLQWRGFGAFLGTMVGSLAAARDAPVALTIEAGERHGAQRALTVSLEVRDIDGRRPDPLAPMVGVRRGATERTTLQLAQVAPGRFETRVIADTTQPLSFSLADDPAAREPARIFVVDQAAEYRFAKPDEPRLAAIAHSTGGSINPNVEDLRRAPRDSGVVRHALAPWLLALGIGLWLTDTVLRRFRR